MRRSSSTWLHGALRDEGEDWPEGWQARRHDQEIDLSAGPQTDGGEGPCDVQRGAVELVADYQEYDRDGDNTAKGKDEMISRLSDNALGKTKIIKTYKHPSVNMAKTAIF